MFATDVEKITQIKLFELFQVVLNKIKTNSPSFEGQKNINKLYNVYDDDCIYVIPISLID